jgi:hypothetical protein
LTNYVHKVRSLSTSSSFNTAIYADLNTLSLTTEVVDEYQTIVKELVAEATGLFNIAAESENYIKYFLNSVTTPATDDVSSETTRTTFFLTIRANCNSNDNSNDDEIDVPSVWHKYISQQPTPIVLKYFTASPITAEIVPEEIDISPIAPTIDLESDENTSFSSIFPSPLLLVVVLFFL